MARISLGLMTTVHPAAIAGAALIAIKAAKHQQHAPLSAPPPAPSRSL
jgi:hypothetical protein